MANLFQSCLQRSVCARREVVGSGLPLENYIGSSNAVEQESFEHRTEPLFASELADTPQTRMIR
jgi:hypothetical protein